MKPHENMIITPWFAPLMLLDTLSLPRTLQILFRLRKNKRKVTGDDLTNETRDNVFS